MFDRLLSENITTSAVVADEQLTNFNLNGLLFDIDVSGTADALSDAKWSDITLNVRLKGEEHNVNIAELDMLEILKISDYEGGFSASQKANANGNYAAYLNLGSLILTGDDVLEVTLEAPGDTDTEFDFDIYATDFKAKEEKILIYESYIGTGQEVLIKNCFDLFLTSAPQGNNIYIDSNTENYYLIDHAIIATGNVLGNMEHWENIGLAFGDKYNLSQNVRVKIPSSTEMVARSVEVLPARHQARNRKIERETSQFLRSRKL